MGLGAIIAGLFGGGRNPVVETLGAFRVNAEAEAQRSAEFSTAALAQYAAEFYARSNRTWLDIFADGLNRLVRPVVTIGLLAPIPATVMDPQGMSEVWPAIATLPAGYWAIVGIVLPFYFGGRMQMKALESSQWQAAATAAAGLSKVIAPEPAQGGEPNAALADWQASSAS